MKRWEDRSDAGKAWYALCGSLLCGAVVVFLPKLIPPVGFTNTLAQAVLEVLALALSFLAGILLQKAYPDWKD